MSTICVYTDMYTNMYRPITYGTLALLGFTVGEVKDSIDNDDDLNKIITYKIKVNPYATSQTIYLELK